ncbi:MAG: CoA transferase [Myxococcales bacterium]|nr:CoA transferase [Myxococcales bacterium]MCH7866769.1 CoA transferase [Myxococcales bacterium]
MAGPLNGIKILEIAGIGPGPFCAMMLSDMGAEVVRVERADRVPEFFPNTPHGDLLNRGRRNIAINLKSGEGVKTLLRLVEGADALIEGFRPGVMERLGLGPDVCLARNPRLVYGRMTGFGQEGPLAQVAGHDINYIALAGALESIGRKGGPPTPPLNLVGDFGGGGMLLAFGVACGLVECATSGKGQVIDAAMIDGSALLMTMFHSFASMGGWNDERGTNLLDTGAHFYDVYETSDGKYISIGSIEPQFYALLLEHSGLGEGRELPHQMDRDQWPALKRDIAEIFKQKTRDQWCKIMEGTDVCFAPVLSLKEAPEHPHNQQRHTFTVRDGVTQPAPAPRYSRTVPEIGRSPAYPGQHTAEVLADWGFDADEIAKLEDSKAIA